MQPARIALILIGAVVAVLAGVVVLWAIAGPWAGVIIGVALVVAFVIGLVVLWRKMGRSSSTM